MPSPFANLTPDTVLDAVESLGYPCDARIYPLNSYENRVYQVGIEGAKPLVAKFYRPGRWSPEQIQEEHQFSLQLAAASVPVVPPVVQGGESLFEFAGYCFALYPRSTGTPIALDDDDHLYALGQAIGQMHQQERPLFQARATLNVQADGAVGRDYLLANAWLPKALAAEYTDITEQILAAIIAAFASVPYVTRPLHGDFHAGNVLWQDGPQVVDFDDALNGPAVQDLWMLLSGSPAAQRLQLEQVLEGYEEHCTFDDRELALIPSLRALRLMNYSAWLARRWEDAAFVKAFPWFNGQGYWASHVKQLTEALKEIQTAGPLSRGQPR